MSRDFASGSSSEAPPLFTTDRLSVDALPCFSGIPMAHLRLLLSAAVTQFLPASWQSLSTDTQIKQWMQAQVEQGDMYGIYSHSERLPIGLFFLYGYASSLCLHGVARQYQQKTANAELRLGYVLIESA